MGTVRYVFYLNKTIQNRRFLYITLIQTRGVKFSFWANYPTIKSHIENILGIHFYIIVIFDNGNDFFLLKSGLETTRQSDISNF